MRVAAARRLGEGRDELDLDLVGLNGDDAGLVGDRPLLITGSRMGHLWQALVRAYDAVGSDSAARADGVFRDLVLARIVEATSKLDSLRVLEEVGVPGGSYATLNRRLPTYAITE